MRKAVPGKVESTKLTSVEVRPLCIWGVISAKIDELSLCGKICIM